MTRIERVEKIKSLLDTNKLEKDAYADELCNAIVEHINDWKNDKYRWNWKNPLPLKWVESEIKTLLDLNLL